MNDEINSGIIPKQTKSEVKLMKGFDAQRFFGLLFTMLVSYFFGILIGGWWRFVFMGFACLVFFIGTSKSPTDPHKKFYQGLLDFLRFLIMYLTVKVRMKTASSKGLVLMVKSIFSVQWKDLP